MFHSQVCDADATTDRQTTKRHNHNVRRAHVPSNQVPRSGGGLRRVPPASSRVRGNGLAGLLFENVDAAAVWKSTHVLQPAKKLNNSAVSKPRAEGERGKKLDLFFDAKNIQNPSERSERRKIIIKKIWRARSAPEKNSNIGMLLSKVQNTKRARIFQNLDFHAATRGSARDP